MVTTLLFDLDGTLLNIDMRVFLKQYFRELGDHLSHIIPPDKLASHLSSSTQVMIENLEENKTNEEVFWEDFKLKVKKPPDLLKPLFVDFYKYKFKKLRTYTNNWPEAKKVIETAVKHNYQLVLATNPVFPSSAIEQRMEWAGIKEYPYKLITTYENMHFCKPNPQYFLEILEKVGVKPQECLMIGNDVDDDLPAVQVGIKTFLVEDFLINRYDRKIKVDYKGKLKELPAFLEELKINSHHFDTKNNKEEAAKNV